MNRYKTLFLMFFLLALNAVLGGCFYAGLVSFKTIFYALCVQGALLGLAAVFIYAKHLTVFFAMLLVAAAILSLRGESVWIDLRVPVTFWVIYSFFWLFYFEFGKTKPGLAIRYLHPLYNFLFYALYMSGAIATCFALTATVFNGWEIIHEIPRSLYIMFVSLAAIIPTVTIGALKIIDIIGAGHVFHFLIGTYHRPVARQRIVLFLDMVGSSGIAEKLEPKKSMAFIARFIFDASLAFRLKGGDIVNYTGDGLVVLWPLDKADQAVASVKLLRELIERNTNYYRKNFGLIPGFRIGLHGGEVIMSQIGEEKLFIGLHGDVVNTAARLEQMCKDLGVNLLFSKTVRQYMSLAMKDKTKHLGRREVRGREEKIDVFTLEETAA